METVFLYVNLSLIIAGFFPQKMMQEPLIKHTCKVINEGYFIFCTVDKSRMQTEITFSYSLDINRESYSVILVGRNSQPLELGAEMCGDRFSDGDLWNRKRIGSPVEKYFLIFHPDFLNWNNSEKLAFFLEVSKSHEKAH